jgi:hypothetical protein
MSTDLFVFLNSISRWETESDVNIQALIDEYELFLKIGGYQSDAIVDSEFDKVKDLAKQVRDTAIAADVAKMAADVAAASMLWSFGVGGAFFIALEAGAIAEQANVSVKAKELNEKMASLDDDIAKRISRELRNYISMFKANNKRLVDSTPRGLGGEAYRSVLYQAMMDMKKTTGALNITIFKEYAAATRSLFKSTEINEVYAALNELNESTEPIEDPNKEISAESIEAYRLFIEKFLSWSIYSTEKWVTAILQSAILSILKKQIGARTKELDEIIKDVNSGRKAAFAQELNNLIERKKELADLEKQLSDKKNQYNAASQDQKAEIKLEIDALERDIRDKNAEIRRVDDRIERANEAMENAESITRKTSQVGWKKMSSVEKVTSVLVVITSIIDILFTVLEIRELVAQYKDLVKKIDEKILPKYKEYFNQLAEASIESLEVLNAKE